MNTLKPLWLYLEIDHWKDIWRPGIYTRGNFKLFLLTFLFIFQFISPLHEYLFCSSPTPSPITFLLVHLTLRAEPPNLLSDAKWPSERMNSSAAKRVHGPSLSFIQWRIQRRGPGGPEPPIIFRPNRDPKGRKNFFWRPPPPYLRVWMTWTTPPYLKVWIRHCYLPPKLLQYVAYAVTLRRHGRAKAEAVGHKLEHILFLKVH